MINKPLLTIGIPSYNRPESLKKLLDSLLCQTYTNFKIIVSENASNNPASLSVLKDISSKDVRFQYYIQETNIGPAMNFKYVLMQSTTKYFMWHSDDDEMSSNSYIEELMNEIEKGYDFVFPNIIKFNINRNGARNYLRENVSLEISKEDNYLKHIYLVKNSYLGYQLVSGIFKRSVLLENVNIWFMSQGYINTPDEGQILHFLLRSYNWSFVPTIAHVKDMTDSYDFRNNLITSFFPNLWHFFGVFGQIAMSKYSNWQKIKFGLVYFVRCVFIWLSIGYYSFKKQLGFIKKV